MSLPRTALALALLVLLLAVHPPRAAIPGAGEPPDESLQGRLLVAAPEMSDPSFAETVILLVRHNRDGALGIALNRPIGERPLKELLATLGEPDAGVQGSVPVYAGGPVDPAAGFVLHSAEYHGTGTLAVDDRIAMTSSKQILSDIGHGKGPAKFLIAFGYSGWGPGQLEGEMTLRQWFTIAADPALVFDTGRVKLWKEAVARRQQSL